MAGKAAVTLLQGTMEGGVVPFPMPGVRVEAREGTGALEMDTWPIVSCHIGAGNKSSIRTASALNHYSHLLRQSW